MIEADSDLKNLQQGKEDNMRIIEINKFLFRNGGSETYIFKLGEALEQHGHEVQYFGMEHEGRCVGNRVNAYTSDMDFHGGRLTRSRPSTARKHGCS